MSNINNLILKKLTGEYKNCNKHSFETTCLLKSNIILYATLLKKVVSKNDHLNSKITSHQCSWIDRLYNDKFHEWKLIPLYLVKYTFEINFKFHSNLDFDGSKILTFPSFYKQLFCNWGIFLLVLLINLPFYHNHFGITKI